MNISRIGWWDRFQRFVRKKQAAQAEARRRRLEQAPYLNCRVTGRERRHAGDLEDLRKAFAEVRKGDFSSLAQRLGRAGVHWSDAIPGKLEGKLSLVEDRANGLRAAVTLCQGSTYVREIEILSAFYDKVRIAAIAGQHLSIEAVQGNAASEIKIRVSAPVSEHLRIVATAEGLHFIRHDQPAHVFRVNYNERYDETDERHESWRHIGQAYPLHSIGSVLAKEGARPSSMNITLEHYQKLILVNIGLDYFRSLGAAYNTAVYEQYHVSATWALLVSAPQSVVSVYEREWSDVS